jgi:hypothetical protein
MLHVFKFVFSDYMDDDKTPLLEGNNIEDFDLPFNLLGISVHLCDDYALRNAC